ncbi:MAG TPA: helix-turn-helix domain-containing protein [Gemmataceae bacterium]|jgi:hypothetical protein
MSALTITEREYLNWEEAARFSGLGVSTLRRLADKGKLTPFRPTAGRVLLSRRQLVDLIEGRGRPTPAA